MKRFAMFVLMFLSLSALADQKKDLEQLYGLLVEEEGITFQVYSNGCTSRDDFRFDVDVKLEPMGPMLPALESHYYIKAHRLYADSCEDVIPYGVKFFVSFDELGIEFGKYHVVNPIGGDKVIAR